MSEKKENTVINDSKMSIYPEISKPREKNNSQNIFKNVNDSRSESSDVNSFISAPKFGGAGSNSDRGSVALSFKSPHFRVDRQQNSRIESLKQSSGKDSEKY